MEVNSGRNLGKEWEGVSSRLLFFIISYVILCYFKMYKCFYFDKNKISVRYYVLLRVKIFV